MKLSEIYRDQCAQAARWDSQRIGKTYQVAMRFSEESQACAENAENIAHCIAYYGDIELADMDLGALSEGAKTLSFPGRNPWFRGLTFLRDNVKRYAEDAVASALTASKKDTSVVNESVPLLVAT